MKLIATFVLLITLLSSLPAFSQSITGELNIPNLDTEKDKLIHQLLDLALSKTGSNVEYIAQPNQLSAGRLVERVESNKVDVFWAGMSPEVEEALAPIRIPIFKGLLGHRIFVIRRGDEHRFKSVKTLSDLQHFSAGQGRFWGDTDILQKAGLPVTTTVKGANLWPMLDGGRFDYFPLAVHEPWSEIDARPDLDLTVDSNVLLVYPFAMYFYVNKNNTELYKAIKTGMNIAIEDGSYDKLLFNSSMLKDALVRAKVADRVVIRIANPAMHPDTPVDVTKYWFDPTAKLF